MIAIPLPNRKHGAAHLICPAHQLSTVSDDHMPNIDSTSRFLSQIREQVSAAALQARTAQGRPAALARPARSSSSPDPQRVLLQRVRAIDRDDPDRRKKAFRIFLESILVDELGKDLLNDPGYHRIVEDVYRTMERNTNLAPAIDKAGEYLLQGAAKR